ncbi:TonB-linked outer membrane protein, SusC/RagA family [Chryseobacterium soldanellicola]|uniref:TonB-linked outer membrane protein, SusC/RagA family n=1 Tax=Chryseobacterium soldanellicola TaxID=311333 RepID=A0A1H1A5W9_9FLAO|nr:SusC/RagA family TonB-linked outer membrane protein [Chryseobacterium soldanellicola]SDQ35057.1 TonB-linked outer membrane protein, SusC/RagA family [Chryseobacterium soldanellicola]
MNVKLRVLTAGVLFFTGSAVLAQQKPVDTTKEAKIEEVVVLGYSKKSTKAKSAAASVTVDSKALENRPNISFINSLQGNAPGISINSTSGSPGSGKIDVMVRGLSSINASTDPLYVIDGLITSATQFRNLNTEDIESISILKDAQATSIYGNRGANGVVVINTKNAKYNSGLRVTYDVLTSFSVLPKTKYNMLDSRSLLNLENSQGVGLGSTLTPEEIAAYDVNTDWNKEFFQTSMLQQHTLGITSGGKNINNYTSLGYLNTDGVFKSTDFQRFTLRNNLNGKSDNGRLTFSMQMAVGYSKRHQLDQETNTGLDNNIVQNPLFGSLLTPSYLESYPFSGGQDMYNQYGGGAAPGWILQDVIRGGVKNLYTETSILANANVNYKLTDWLSVGNRSGIDYKETDRTFARDPRGYLSIAAKPTTAQFGGLESISNTKDLTFNSVTNITFDKKFGDHSLTVAAYLDYVKAHYLASARQQNGLDPFIWAFGSGTGYIPFNPATPSLYLPSVSAAKINAGTLAYVGTLDYDYAGKYGVSATVRRDGSYRFSPDNRWETFWSVGGRWNLDKEDFLSGSNTVKMLKIRGSYGTTGNQNLVQPANNGNPLFSGTNLYSDLVGSGAGYMNLPGYGATIGNPNIKWEKVTQANIGVDFALFNNFVEGTFDIYKKTTDRLFNGISLSAVTGQYSINGNNGKLENKGIEGSLRFNVLKNKDYSLSLFANGAYNKNEIVEFEGADLSGDNVNAAGGPIGQWNLYHYAGVNAQTGEMQFIGADGNITEAPTANDKVLTGKSYIPKFTGGFGLNADYKGWFADVLFSYQAGGWMYDNVYSWLMDPSSIGVQSGFNFSGDILNSWTPENTNTNVPSLNATNLGTDGSSDRFLYKTDFIRLKNVTFGYNFKKDMLRGLPISSIKVFVQAENLVTWTNWRGYDPEPLFSYSLSVYPNPKVVSVGLNVQF